MLSGNVYIITGGGNGLGKATATYLGERGATVVVNDLGTDVHGEGQGEEPAVETAKAISDGDGEASPHFGDVSSMDYAQKLVSDTLDQYGRIDGIANFASIIDDSFLTDMDADSWDSVVRVHLRSHFTLLKSAATHWKDRAECGNLDSQRSFVCLSSESAMGNVGQSNYSAAKAGVLGLTRTAARELDRYDIRVNALMPRAHTRTVETIPEEKRPDVNPPRKVAPSIGYLLSDSAEGITGCTIKITGDMIGLVEDPQVTRVGVKSDGWEFEDIESTLRDELSQGFDLTRLDHLDT